VTLATPLFENFAGIMSGLSVHRGNMLVKFESALQQLAFHPPLSRQRCGAVLAENHQVGNGIRPLLFVTLSQTFLAFRSN